MLVSDSCPLSGGSVGIRDHPPVEQRLGGVAVHLVVSETVDVVIGQTVFGQVAHRIGGEGLA